MAVVAFALALICILAGRRPGYMEQYSLLTVNTSQIGQFNLSASSPAAATILNRLPGNFSRTVQNLVGNVTNDVAKAIGVKDFYSAHILTYCEGSFEPNGTTKAGAMKNVTKCSNETTTNSFNVTNILQMELINGVTLKDLNWPEDIENGLRALRTAWRATFVLYVIGIVTAGLAFLGGIVTVCLAKRISILSDAFVALISFLSIGIASAIATFIIVKVTNLINKYGSTIGIAASRGGSYLAITWTATVLMLIATCFWFGQCCFHRKQANASKWG
ncbi:MAG: hypothetical protein M1814_004698 [Vezdaea aestivalis]|nr:MAG: hypothetical protein M1814_004698 [Vezdaea aestivalis]